MAFQNLIYLLVALCIFQFSLADEGDIQELKSQLSRSKNNVREVTSGISRFKHEIQFSTNSKVTVPATRSKRIMHDLLQSAIIQINKDANEAIRKGKNRAKVEICMNNANKKLWAAGDKKSELDVCALSGKQTVTAQINSLNGLISRGNQLTGQLDSVFSRCAGGNAFKVQKCVQVLLQNINRSIESYELDAANIKKQAETNINNSLEFLKKCNSQNIESIRALVANEKQEAARCLQNA